MILNRILRASLMIMLVFSLGGCKDDAIEDLKKSYNLNVSPKSHIFDAEGGELVFEVTATVGLEKHSQVEDVAYETTISGEGFSLNGNKIIAEKNEGPRRFGKLTVTIEGSDLERIVELTQNGDESNPLPGSISEFKFTDVEAEIQIDNYSIHAVIPAGANITSLVPHIVLSEGTILVDFENDVAADFTNEVEIKVMGTDNITHTYVVTVESQHVLTGFSNVVEKFTVLQSSFPEHFNVANRIQSMAVSGNQILLKTSYIGALANGNILYYNALTGASEGQLPTHHGINRMATDSQGRIVGTTLTDVEKSMSLFTLENVTSPRVTFYQGVYQGEAGTQYGNGGPVNVYGDISGNAVIFTPIFRSGKTPIGHRWVIENGVLASSSPELISYGEQESSEISPYGNIGFGIPVGPKVTDGYIFGSRGEFAYHNGAVKYIFKKEDTGSWTYGGPGGGKVFTMNGKKYFAVWRANTGNGGFFNILDITNPAAIVMTDAERTAAGIDFVQYESSIFNETLGANNSMWGNIDVKYLDNGNVMLYFMYNNAGVRAYELIKNQ